VLADGPGQQRRQAGQHDQHADHHGDRGGGVPHYRADRERHQAEHGEVEPDAEDRAQGGRVAQ
jgi:hypothetical protein